MNTRVIWFLVVALGAAIPAAARTGQDAGEDVKYRIQTRNRVRTVERERQRERRDRNAAEQTEQVSRTAHLGPSGEFHLSNISGNIVVKAGAGNDVRIEAIKRVRAQDDAEARRQLGMLDIVIAERPERVEVRTVYPRNERHFNGSVEYSVTVPAGARVNLRSVSGDIRLGGVKGDAHAESVSGNVVVESASRVAVAKSVSGDVQILAVGADGDVTASSVSGSVSVRGVKVKTLDAGTVSGDVILTKMACGRAYVRSVSGNLEYAGTLARNGRYELKSHSGNVRLALTGDVGFEVEATSFSGGVRSDLPITLRTGHSDEHDGRGPRRRNSAVRGQYGDGSAILEITTFSGNVAITRP
jgi:DUF4097 and DUF4098 domain-containing protein YvlB